MLNERTIENLPLVLDSTILSTFRACEEKAALEYLEHLAPSTVGLDLHFGGAFASGLEALYTITNAEGSLAAGLGAAEYAYLQKWGDYEIPEHRLSGPRSTAKTKERGIEALHAYAEKWNPLHDHIRPHPDVEKPAEYSFGIPLTMETTGLPFPVHPATGDPFIYAGRFDLLGLYGDRACVRDDKTASSMSARWSDDWTLRAQFMGYTWAMSVLGHPIDCVIVRGVVIQKTQFQFIEVEKRYPQHIIDRWLRVTFTDVSRFLAAVESGAFRHSFGTECTSYSGCAFRDLCASPEPDRWKGDFAQRHWNPLGNH